MDRSSTSPTVHDAIADDRPDAEAIVFGDRRLTWPTSPSARAAWPTSSSARTRLPHRALGARRPRERPGPPRDLPAQRQRVPRVDARRVQGPGRAVQRQLPLRRRGAALPAQRLAARWRSSCTVAVRPDARRGARPTLPQPARRSSRSPTQSGNPCCPARSGTRTHWQRRPPTAARRRRRAPTTSTSSTRVAPPACPRACCGAAATRWSSASGRRRQRPTLDDFVAEADGGLRALLAPPFMHGAGHWMSFRTWNTRRHGLRAVDSPSASTRSTCGAWSSASSSTSC